MKNLVIIFLVVMVVILAAGLFVPNAYQTIRDFVKSEQNDSVQQGILKQKTVQFRKFPYQQIINYKVSNVTANGEKDLLHYAGGCLRYEEDRPCIYVNEFTMGGALQDSTNAAKLSKTIDGFNSSMRRQFTLYYAFTQSLNDVYHLQNLSRKDEILVNKYDDISACLSVLLLAREIYLETGDESIFPEQVRFYRDAVKAKKIVPQKANITEAEAEFIINELSSDWQKNLETKFAVKDVPQNLAYSDIEDLSEDALKKIIKPFFAYEIDGQRINFLDYLKTKIELTTLELISVNSREIK